MHKLIASIAALTIAVGAAACGGDDDGGDSESGDDFASQAAEICIEAASGVRDVNLELGYATMEEDLIERLERVLEVRQQALVDLQALEPPAESADAFEGYLAAREDLVAATEPELAAREDDDVRGAEDAVADATEAAEQIDKTGADVGVDECAGILPNDDAQAAEDVLREYATTADPATSCSSDELVTEIYVEEGFGGVEVCEEQQEQLQENPGQLAEDIKVAKVTGVDDIVATLEYEDEGGEFDGLPSQAQLFYVDGAWRIFSIAEATE